MKKYTYLCVYLFCSILILTAFLSQLFFSGGETVNMFDMSQEYIDSLKEKNTILNEELSNYKKEFEELEKTIDNQTTSKYEEYKAYAGLTDVKGEGITLNINTMGDLGSGSFTSFYNTVLLAVNDLNAAGAEAVCINEERLVSTSEIVVVGNYIMINGKKIIFPINIKAIGDKSVLEGALALKYGAVDRFRKEGFFIEIKQSDDIFIPKYKFIPRFKFAEIYHED